MLTEWVLSSTPNIPDISSRYALIAHGSMMIMLDLIIVCVTRVVLLFSRKRKWMWRMRERSRDSGVFDGEGVFCPRVLYTRLGVKSITSGYSLADIPRS